MPMPVPGIDFDPAEDQAAADDHPLLAQAAGATLWGLDYAWQNLTPAALARLLASNSADFACRYINDPGGKGLTDGEARALTAAGIILAPVYETTGTDFTGGYDAGLTAGQRAAADLRARGAPGGTYCWFAIDTDTGVFAETNAYLRGAKAGTGAYVAQLYGSYAVVEAAAAAGLGSAHWQTYAWSKGKLSRHALLYQFQNAVMIGGISMDRDRTVQPMAGPWAHPAAAAGAPVRPSAPAFPYPAADYLGVQSPDAHCHSGFSAADRPHVAAWQAQMARRGWAITVDGRFGAQSEAVARSFQGEKNLAADGKVGPQTWAAAWTAAVT